ncbi:MAG TPA: nuclear transport factor 2 family protein [Dermatophilaceae bacterium]|nr:nuclear transport factor 2 family protein [Dermatophilaceae bacterium]
MAGKSDELRQRYERFRQGDLERALDLWTDDFVWDGDESGLPGSGRHEGKQAAVDVLQQAVGAWDTFDLSADEFIEQGDTVVVLGHSDATKDGRSAHLPFVHIWRYRGEQICRLQLLTDTLLTARALGLA